MSAYRDKMVHVGKTQQPPVKGAVWFEQEMENIEVAYFYDSVDDKGNHSVRALTKTFNHQEPSLDEGGVMVVGSGSPYAKPFLYTAEYYFEQDLSKAADGYLKVGSIFIPWHRVYRAVIVSRVSVKVGFWYLLKRTVSYPPPG